MRHGCAHKSPGNRESGAGSRDGRLGHNHALRIKKADKATLAEVLGQKSLNAQDHASDAAACLQVRGRQSAHGSPESAHAQPRAQESRHATPGRSREQSNNLQKLGFFLVLSVLDCSSYIS